MPKFDLCAPVLTPGDRVLGEVEENSLTVLPANVDTVGSGIQKMWFHIRADLVRSFIETVEGLDCW